MPARVAAPPRRLVLERSQISEYVLTYLNRLSARLGKELHCSFWKTSKGARRFKEEVRQEATKARDRLLQCAYPLKDICLPIYVSEKNVLAVLARDKDPNDRRTNLTQFVREHACTTAEGARLNDNERLRAATVLALLEHYEQELNGSVHAKSSFVREMWTRLGEDASSERICVFDSGEMTTPPPTGFDSLRIRVRHNPETTVATWMRRLAVAAAVVLAVALGVWLSRKPTVVLAPNLMARELRLIVPPRTTVLPNPSQGPVKDDLPPPRSPAKPPSGIVPAAAAEDDHSTVGADLLEQPSQAPREDPAVASIGDARNTHGSSDATAGLRDRLLDDAGTAGRAKRPETVKLILDLAQLHDRVTVKVSHLQPVSASDCGTYLSDSAGFQTGGYGHTMTVCVPPDAGLFVGDRPVPLQQQTFDIQLRDVENNVNVEVRLGRGQGSVKSLSFIRPQ